MILNIGYDNYINMDKVQAISKPESSPTRRQIKQARENDTLIDCTMGKATLSVIYTDCKIILSAVHPRTLKERLHNAMLGIDGRHREKEIQNG